MSFGISPAPGLADGLGAAFFNVPRAVRMHLHAGSVQADHVNPDTRNLAALQLSKDALEYASFAPAAHAGIDGVPVAQVRRQTAPLATVLEHVKYGVEHLKIGQLDVATVHRQAVCNFFVLGCSVFFQNRRHALRYATASRLANGAQRHAAQRAAISVYYTSLVSPGVQHRRQCIAQRCAGHQAWRIG